MLRDRYGDPCLMGVVNATPDSFSDGGELTGADEAIARGHAHAAAGAAIVDVGGESTRPGSLGVDASEELRRVLPVVEALAAEGIAVSVDTSKAEVARRCLDAGAVLVNDVTALRGDADLAGVVAAAGAALCLMHMQGEPRTMQDDPRYDDVVGEVGAFLEERLAAAVAAGIAEEAVCLDPGIGFGKTLDHNLDLLRGLPRLALIGRPLVVGVSRKRSIGTLTGRDDPAGRVHGSVAAGLAALDRGAWCLRVHDVAAHADALAVWRAIAREEVDA